MKRVITWLLLVLIALGSLIQMAGCSLLNPGRLVLPAKEDIQKIINEAQDGDIIDIVDLLVPEWLYIHDEYYGYWKTVTRYDDYTFVIPKGLVVTLAGDPRLTIAGIAFVCEGGNTITLDDLNIYCYQDQAPSTLHFTYGKNELILKGSSRLENAYQPFDTTNDERQGYGAAVGVPPEVTLTISGQGCLYATGNGSAASIGGGYNESSGSIIITDGYIDASVIYSQTGMCGAAIGGGSGAAGGKTTINGGRVYVSAYNGAAGIGGGYGAGIGEVTINGGKVFAIAQDGGAAIGSSVNGGNGLININGGEVSTYGSAFSVYSNSSPGIGNGVGGSGVVLNIKGGILTAWGDAHSDQQAINCMLRSLPSAYRWSIQTTLESGTVPETFPDKAFVNDPRYYYVRIEAE
jgi:hypothetical protein